MTHEEIDLLPGEGLVSLKALAKYLGTTDVSLIEGLKRNNIPFLKLTKFHAHWLIRLEDLRTQKI